MIAAPTLLLATGTVNVQECFGLTRSNKPAARILLRSDIASHANAVGGKCLRQHEARARGRAIPETPHSPIPQPAPLAAPICASGRS
jgi:hypothetical protein